MEYIKYKYTLLAEKSDLPYGDIQFIIPRYTTAEYNSIVEKYNQLSEKYVFSLDNELTETGKFVLYNMGFSNTLYPYVKNGKAPSDVLNFITSYITLSDVSSILYGIPDSEIVTNFAFKKYRFSDINKMLFNNGFFAYRTNTDEYRPSWQAPRYHYIFGSYGNNDSTHGSIYLSMYMLVDNVCYGVGINGTSKRLEFTGLPQLGIQSDFEKYITGTHNDPYTPPEKDPYTGGGTSGSGGGGGTYGGGNTIFGGNSDSIDVPPLPTASASSAGFITLFNPSLAQLNNLANYMWSDLFSLDTFKKIFADPMDCILGLSIVPVKPASAGTSAVKIGNISTDVSMNRTSTQYVAVDCGTIDVKEYWGAYLDYAPYTQCEIYLPYVGTKQISVDDVMNKSVHVVYHVDILSGACNAYVKCGDSVLYTFVGQCSSSIPISGNDWTNVLNGAISVAGKIGLAMATGGATALMSGLGAASSIISSSKPTVERSGAMSSTGGLLGIQKPYLILTRPKQALPENQNKYTGYPSFITMVLSDCTGYTEVDSVHLENMTCTDEEAQEIENLLKSGVIF